MIKFLKDWFNSKPKQHYKIMREGVLPYAAYHLKPGLVTFWAYIGYGKTLDEAKEVIEIHKRNPVYEE